MSELERYKAALEAITCIGGGASAAERAWQIAKDALNPPPAYEEVTVERWECAECGRVYMADGDREPGMCGYLGCESRKYNPLPFTRRVAVQPKVVRRVSIPAIIGDGKGKGTKGEMFGIKPRYSALENYPECHGKTGTLTFEWAE